MSKKRHLAILTYILFSLVSYAQKDLDEFGLKGKVKIFTTTSYQIFKTENNQTVPKDTGMWYMREIHYFNKKGNIDSVVRSYNRRYYKTSAFTNDTTFSFITRYVTQYEYDGTGKKISGTEIANMGDQRFSYIRISQPSKNLYVESRVKYGDKNPSAVDSVWIGKNGRDSVIVGSIVLEKDLVTWYTYQAFYDTEGQLERYVEIEGIPFERNEITLQIITKDDLGNPTLIKLYKNKDPEPAALKYRSYIYY